MLKHILQVEYSKLLIVIQIRKEMIMGIQSLEQEVLAEAKIVTGNKKLRMKDIMEWSTSKIKAQENEKLYKLPKLGIHIAVKIDD